MEVKVSMVRSIVLFFALLSMPFAQQPPELPGKNDNKPARMPNGKLQSEEILKEEHKKSLDDIAKLIEVAEQLQDELIKNDHHVLSLGSVKKAEEIEKLAKRLKGRIRK